MSGVLTETASNTRTLNWLLGVCSALLLGAAATSVSALQRITSLEAKYDSIVGRFDRIEDKLDQALAEMRPR